MHLIVFTHRLATPRSLTVSARHVALAVALSLAVMVTGAALLYYITFRYAANLKLPVCRTWWRRRAPTIAARTTSSCART